MEEIMSLINTYDKLDYKEQEHLLELISNVNSNTISKANLSMMAKQINPSINTNTSREQILNAIKRSVSRKMYYNSFTTK